ncbi:MAG: bifunctional 2-keto-4-hydroxyglutarate aldolase/2-keto-3-deoxy-6-phosphogluconate aldolase [Gammaproteobacteria bacterium]|nr:bifunctional 2-keto-4-hydroxyglutarate aldolase/2-keto-3-deoxy-6-phosphogluconate aldolase [Gammaproteobacteria bacterium]
MKKQEILKQLTDSLVVAVVRATSTEQAVKISQACIDGGIKAIEVTFTVDYAHDVIKGLKKEVGNSLLIGAGTVLDSETARVAILNGADFIVSPAFDLETAKLCNRYQVPYLPGCMTITEMIHAMEAGADIVKLFPGSLPGPSYVKAVKGPLPQANIMPTGGVSLANIKDWFNAGVVAVGVGGELTAPAKTGDYEKVKENAIAFIKAAKEAKGV